MSRLHLDEVLCIVSSSYSSKPNNQMGFVKKYLACKHLAAQCFYDAQLYSDALHLLRNDHMWNDTAQLPPNFHQDGPLLAAQQLSVSIFSSLVIKFD